MSRKSRPKPFPMQVVLGTKTREEMMWQILLWRIFFCHKFVYYMDFPRHFSFRFFPRSVVWSRSGGTSQPNDTYLAQTLVWDLRRWFSTGGVVGKKFMENPVHVDEQFQSFTWYWETISICHYIAIMSHCPPLTGSWFVGFHVDFQTSCTSWYGRYPIIYKVLYMQTVVGLGISEPSTVVFKNPMMVDLNPFFSLGFLLLFFFKLIGIPWDSSPWDSNPHHLG